MTHRKTISARAYAKKIDAIAKMGAPVADTLIAMLEEASNYNIKKGKKK
jgi:hypothetical protein